MITLPQPPITASSPQQINNYLIQLANYLNVALNRINEESLAPEFREALAAVNQNIQNDKTAAEKGFSQFNTLKSLIIKTADTIYQTMDSEFEKYSGLYVANSDFGDYVKETEQTISKNAEATEFNFSQVENIVSDMKINIYGYIRLGNLGQLGEGVDQYGIGIGQYTVSQDEDGNIVYDDTQSNDYCTITSTKITFWDNGSAVAYISNDKLYINKAHLNTQLDIGYTEGGEGKWRMMGEPGKGFVIKWVGGN